MHKRRYIYLFSAALLWCVGCNDAKREMEVVATTSQQVVIGASMSNDTRGGEGGWVMDESLTVGEVDVNGESGSQAASAVEQGAYSTRTSLEEIPGSPSAGTLQGLRWSDRDKINVWAERTGDIGENVIVGEMFAFNSYNAEYDSADFEGSSGNMFNYHNDGDIYNYYAFYPYQTGFDELSVDFSLPSTQNGLFNPSLAAMVGKATGYRLATHDGTQVHYGYEPQPEMKMSNLFHLLRIQIPENGIHSDLGSDITHCVIEFYEVVDGVETPLNVVGDVNYHIRSGEMTWSNESNRVVVDMSNSPATAGGRYAWVFIKPIALSNPAVIKFKSINANIDVPAATISKSIAVNSSTQMSLNMQSNHITPIRLSVPQKSSELQDMTAVVFSCPDSDVFPNFLGESAQTMYIKSNATKSNGQQIEPQMGTELIATDGNFTSYFYYIPQYGVNEDLAGATLSASFKSANADVSDVVFKKVTINQTFEPQTNDLVPYRGTGHYALPYLMYEDFQGLKEEDYGFATTGSGGDAGVYLTEKGVDLPGWTGAGWETVGGDDMLITAYIGSSWSGTATECSNGRIDTKALPLIRGGVTITSTYMVGGHTEASEAKNSCFFGTTTQTGAIGATNSYKNPNKPDVLKESFVINNGAQVNVPKTNTIDNCGSGTRLTWCCNPTDVGTGFWDGYVTGKFFRVYIDDIKVSVGSSVKWSNSDLTYRDFFPKE